MTDGAAAGPGPRPDPPRVVFFGSGSFAVPILEALMADPAVLVVAVVSTPDRPAGRRATPVATPVGALAVGLGLPLLRPERLREPSVVAAIAALDADLGVLADYGRIVPPDLLTVPRHGILNVHPSILPRHRGATPVPATILADDPEAGVTVMAMDAGLDTGPVVASRRWPLRGDETAPELEAVAAVAGAALLAETLPGWIAGTIPAVPQDETRATLTRPFRRADGQLDPARPAAELERRVRALRPWPGTYLETTRGRLAVHEAATAPAEPGDRAGHLVASGDGIALATGAGRLVLGLVQPAGGRPMPGPAFRRGAGRALVGTAVAGPGS